MPPEDVAAATLRLLDVPLLNELERHLPFAWYVEDESIEVRALVKVKFLKVKRRQRYKGSPPLASWEPAGAELTVLPGDVEPPIPLNTGGTSND